MTKRTIYFKFSGLFFCLVLFSLAEEYRSTFTETLNVAPLCSTHNGTADLRDLSHAFVEYEIYFLFDCEVLLGNGSSQNVVISFDGWSLTENDQLVLRDNHTELSFTGDKWYYGDKSFIFRGPTTIHFTTKDTFSHILITKFKFLFTVTNMGFPCKHSDFTCSNRMCLNSRWLVCDGKNNCGDWSDEIGCQDMEYIEEHGRCTDGEYSCVNHKCIPMNKVCNGYNDCGDMSDEDRCNEDCNSTKRFRCDNGLCIWNDELCNHKDNCGDWSDEKNCHRNCDTYRFPCSNRRCIEFWKVCDGDDDCGDWSDEKKCRLCSSSEHKCPNGLCIPKYFICNNNNDCGDFSDEKGCSSTINWIPESETKPLILPIILSSVAIGSVLILLITLSICFCVSVAKRSKQPNNTSASSDQQSAPTSLIGRMRQSLRLHGQPSAPPLEMATADESGSHEWQQAPSLMERIRQSFRSRQPTVQPPNAITTSDVRSENPDGPAIYPNLPTGVDNPEINVGQ